MADPTNPFSIAGSQGGGGTANPFTVGGGAGSSAAPQGHGGSLLGNLAGDVAGTIGGLGTAIGTLGTTLATHPVRTVEHTPSFVKDAAVGFAKGVNYDLGPAVGALGRALEQDAQTIVGNKGGAAATHEKLRQDVATAWEHFHTHPLGPLLDVATLFTGGGARLASLATLPEGATAGEILNAALRGHYAGPLKTIEVRGAEGGAPVTVRTLPRNAARAARMQATDSLLKKLSPNTPVVGEFARAARAIKTETLPVELAHLASDPYENYRKAYAALSGKQRVALAVLGRVPLEKDLAAWKATLPAGDVAAQKLAKLIDHPTVLAEYRNPSTKLLAAHTVATALDEARTAIQVRTGALSQETADAARFRHMRVARGAAFVPETAARLGKPSKQLAFLRSHVDRLQVLHDRAVGKIQAGTRLGPEDAMIGGKIVGPGEGRLSSAPTDVSASRYRLAKLEQERNAELDKMAAGRFGPADRREVNYRTFENARAARQASGKNRAGKNAGYTGRKSVTRQTVTDERRMILGQEIEDRLRANPSDPVLKRWADREAEIEKLKALAHPMIGETAKGVRVGPGRVVSAPGAARTERLGAALSVAKDKLASMEEAAARRATPTGLVGGGTPERLAAEVKAAGRPLPFYSPDKMAGRGIGFARRGSGLTPPGTDVHAFTGELFKKGLIAVHTDTLGPSFLRAAIRDRTLELNRRAIAAAVPSQDGRLAAGYRWVRTVRGQSIPHVATGYGQHLAGVDEAFPELASVTIKPEEAHAVEEIATDQAGQRLMVPERFAKVLESDLSKGQTAVQRVMKTPMLVWRAMILNLRVPWLINNVIGNTLMATVRFGGVNGLRAVLGMIAETHGVAAAREALGWAESTGHLTAADMNELLPELSKGGTFIGSQLPTGLLARAPEAVQKAARVPGKITSFLPGIDRATEGALRRASAETVLRGSQEVKARYRAMPGQTRSWRAAMRQGIETNPDLRRLVVREVNDALGNFLSLSHAEAGAIRTLAPFYAWFREITRITLKLPLDTPGRARILTMIGQVGQQESARTLGPQPSFLQGDVAVGAPQDGMQEILALRSANPYTSFSDVASGLGALVGLGSGSSLDNLVGMANPFLQGGITYLERQHAHQKTGAGGLLGQALTNVVTGLPETRIGTNPASRLYPGRTRGDLLAQILGDPRRRISLQQAHFYASQGR